ncbi:MAG TPA: RpiB/LacA/LacB family sugar-phosphate isomerase [Tepidisphaeraceae bacterium]|jgi:ribose 5-phosphate isomerase B
MKVAIACDHRGYDAKRRLLPMLNKLKHEVTDFGCSDASTNVDYPDIAVPAARAVADGRCDVGILLEGSGIGMAIVANKIRGVRAVLAHDEFTARRSREHHHCNIVCVGADLLSEDQIRQIVQIFLATPRETGKHTRRIEKIRSIEEAG